MAMTMNDHSYRLQYPCLSRMCSMEQGSAFLRELGLFGEPKQTGFATMCYVMHCSATSPRSKAMTLTAR